MLGSTGLGDTYIFPDDTKLYDTLRNGSDLKSSLVFGMLLEERRIFQGGYKIYRRYESATQLSAVATGKAHPRTPARTRARMQE